MHPTNDPSLTSFIEVEETSHFPIQNLPYGVCKPKDGGEAYICSRIGDQIVNLKELEEAGVFDGPELDGKSAFQSITLNDFMALGKKAWAEARQTLSTLLSAEEPTLRDNESLREAVLTPADKVEMMLPVAIGDYTDFYSSEEHATNVGTMFRGPENALKPNWKHLPVGYHGRASSVVVSGTELHRPKGQTIPADADQPVFGPSKRVDFELEMGFLTGPGNPLGDSIDVTSAEDHIFGLALVNDWSARDIQKWEYVPLGPFLAKNWATTMSPWIVPLMAFEPFRVEGPDQEPEPLPYLQVDGKTAVDINLEVYIKTEGLDVPEMICNSNYKYLYWNMAQQLAHQTVTGCNVRPGDLYASGTISGKTEDSYGSLLELTWNGENPIDLPSGEQRVFCEDGDEIIMTGYAQGDGYRVGFGECSGKILPAK
ncbi:MAG: fumarylacetoacetase [Bacteroidota bacterium]